MRPEYRSHFTADVAVERIESRLGFTLGLPAQFAPERRKFQRRVTVAPFRISRSRWCQSAFLSFVTNLFPVRPLRSTGVTRLPRYYEPVRLPMRPASGYVFPESVEVITLTVPALPGSSANLSARAALFHPGEPNGFSCSLFPRWWQASPSLAGWPSRTSRNEADSGSLTLRLTPSLSGASTRQSPNAPPASLPAERAIRRVTSSQVTRLTRLGLAHQSRKERVKM